MLLKEGLHKSNEKLQKRLRRFNKKLDKEIIDWKLVMKSNSFSKPNLAVEILIEREFIALYEDVKDIPKRDPGWVVREARNDVVCNPAYSGKIMFFNKSEYARSFARHLEKLDKTIAYKVDMFRRSD